MEFLGVLLSVAFCVGFTTGQPIPVNLTMPQDGSTYKIQAYNSYCLVVKDWSNAVNYVTEVSVCEGDIALWTVKSATNYPNSYRLVNKYTGKCLTAGTDLVDLGNNTPVLQYGCQAGGHPTQMWWVDPNTQYLIWSGIRGSGSRCLSYEDAWKGKMYMYDCNTQAYSNQRLHFVGPFTD